ncbi:MAG: lysine biosynthesis protein [Thermoprotei archaeon ex4572_64]|nr:MAG: lysine biosynthesis protein [Thermoprotei archaeon ex4572_64]
MSSRKFTCDVCGSEIEVPADVMDGELISCPTCGQKYQVVIQSENVQLKAITVEAEDWGE